ncbi:membrane protein [Pseudidiomarina salinarum]|uniref:Membrane protein n=1 Tax=Pseudidiomarina salinarum TaxID=435908 RepID=A0A094IY31_9GAMM|nr:membrane protein [Pseudidiomarina salinarum]RUO70211.1 hypothetical protein CWI79_01705 [Pseudidiomarina salinarum]
MMSAIQDFLNSITLPDSGFRMIAASILLIIIVFISRALLARFIRRTVLSSDLRRRWLVQTRNGLLLVMLLGLTLIWAQELRTLALSIVAIAVAFVVATKELILCVIGSIIKSGARAFTIGDRIQVKDFRGDVIDQSLLATTILEVGPGKLAHSRTGRMTVIPNSIFVSEPVINESFTHDYVLHVFTVPFKREDDWRSARLKFQDVAARNCQDYLEQARKYMARQSDIRGVDVPSVDPRVTLQVPTAGEIHLIVRFPVRADKRNFIEQQILADVFLDHDFSAKKIAEKASE